MITENGTTWTEPAETSAIDAHFAARYGEDRARPECVRCGGTTEYVVEPLVNGRPRPGVALYLTSAAPNVRCLVKDGTIYLPSPTCLDCGARQDAWTAARQGRKEPDLRGACMTEAERARFRRIHELKRGDVERRLDEEREKSAARYRT